MLFHKLSDELASSEQESAEKVEFIRRWLLKNPRCVVVDDLEAVKNVTRRSLICRAINTCSLQYLKGDWGSPPSWLAEVENCVVKQCVPLVEGTPASDRFIVKSEVACGVDATHSMLFTDSLQFTLDAKSPLCTLVPCSVLIQECLLSSEMYHVPELVFKIYVVGNNIWVRVVSTKNLTPSINLKNAFHSQNKNLFVKATSADSDDKWRLYFDNTDNFSELQRTAAALKSVLALRLFGFDVLLRQSLATGEVRRFIVDVNYFPGYKDVDEVEHCVLRELLTAAEL